MNDALRLFRNGFDTIEIAKLSGLTEAQVCRQMEVARIDEKLCEASAQSRRGMAHLRNGGVGAGVQAVRLGSQQNSAALALPQNMAQAVRGLQTEG